MTLPKLFAISCVTFAWIAASAAELTEQHRSQHTYCRELQQDGKWQEARDIAMELVAAFANDAPSRHQLVFTNELANLEQRLGNYGRASDLYASCLDIAGAVGGAESKVIAQLQNNLAALKQVTGDFAEAERLNRSALALREKIEGEGSVETVPAMNNLAGLLWCIGDLDGAETLYRKGLQIREQSLGAENIDTARSMANLGGLLFYQNEAQSAAPFVEKAVTVFESASGPTHPETLEALLFLGEVERARDNPARALELYRRVFSGRIQAFGDTPHVETAEAMRRIADAERELGNHNAALEMYQKSDAFYTAVLPAHHPDRIEGLYGYGLSALAGGDRELAGTTARELTEIEFANLRAVLAFTDERQRLAYQNLFRSPHLHANLGNADDVAGFLLRSKGVVIDSLLIESQLTARATSDTGRQLQADLAAARARFRKAFLTGGLEGVSIEKAAEEVKRIRDQLLAGSRFENGQEDPTGLHLADLQATLAPDEALIDFLAFDRYGGNANFLPRYAAVVIRRDSVEFVDAADKEPIDSLLATLLPYGEGLGQMDDAATKEAFRALHRDLIEPALTHLSGIKTLHICPEGSLNFIPFACLVGADGKFLIEHFDIGYVSAARELLRPASGENRNRPVLIGDPEFSSGEKPALVAPGHRGMLASMGTATLSLVADSLTQLAGAKAEVEALQGLFQSAGESPQVMIGEEATEPAVRAAIRQPRILHIATHGIYMPDLQPPPEGRQTASTFIPDEVAGFQNPLFGSWLALGGAQNTVKSWSEGSVPDPSNDGILMANEAADLNLDGTLLVTLSACDTAGGEATNGDGVIGIRRGFRIAGAQNVLTTLWPINDAMTLTLMKEFYEGISRNQPAESLSSTQRKWLVHIRDNPSAVQLPTQDGGTVAVGGFAWAVNLAGPFLLSR